jgi:AcrR family transcriptional regulator
VSVVQQAEPAARGNRSGKGKPRKRRDADQTQAAIVAAAMVEFAAKGLAGARVDAIALMTATSKHMIYYYFGSKEGLYRATLEHAYNKFRMAEEAIDYDAMAPVEALAAFVGQSFDSHFTSPEFVRIIIGENINNGEHMAEVEGLERRRGVLDSMAGIIDRGVTSGHFRSDIDMLQLHMTISSMCFYFVSNRHTFGHIFGLDLASPEQAETRRAQVIDSVLRICRS